MLPLSEDPAPRVSAVVRLRVKRAQSATIVVQSAVKGAAKVTQKTNLWQSWQPIFECKHVCDEDPHYGRGLMHEITILSTMGHALHLPGRSHASDLALYRDKSNALHSMKDVMHHRIQTQF